MNGNEPRKNSASENLMQLMSFTADKALEMAEVNSIIGERIEVGDTVIIPISKVSAGFAGGGASITNATAKKANIPSGSGASVTVTPLSVLVISYGEVKVMDINAPAKGDKKNIIKAIIEQVKKFKKKDEK